tara:strand:- start:515 stop:943 length:429 start_codon:yes stop_codon:yes gene_type:complete
MDRICHICLEEGDNLSEEDIIIKECCDAFICNVCWIELNRNPNITECPICRRSLRENVIQYNRSLNDNYGYCIDYVISLLSWIIIGFLSFIIILLITYYDNLFEFLKELKYVCSNLHFWIAITFMGFIIKNMIYACWLKYCS